MPSSEPFPPGENAPPPLPPAGAGASEQPPPLPPSAAPRQGKTYAVLVAVCISIFLYQMTWKTTFIIGVGLVVASVLLARRQHTWLRSARIVPGVVVKLIESPGTDNSTYSPLIRYTTPDGAQREFDHGAGSNPPAYTVGQAVLVAYDAEKPAEGNLATFDSQYGWAAWGVGLGMALALLGAIFIVGRLAMPRVYRADREMISSPHGR